MSAPPRMHHKRRAILARVRDEADFVLLSGNTCKWAKREGFLTEAGKLTDAGAVALADAEIDPAWREAMELLTKLRGKTLCREFSQLPEAQADGFLYFTEPDHKAFPGGAARILIAEGHLVPREDGLFAGISQTFEVASHG